jgi:hypothetical protein
MEIVTCTQIISEQVRNYLMNVLASSVVVKASPERNLTGQIRRPKLQQKYNRVVFSQ